MKRRSKYLILLLKNEGLFYNENEKLAWAQTNFPDKNKFGLKDQQPIYWKMEMVAFDKDSKTLTVKLVDYDSVEVAVFQKQRPKADIRKIIFEPLNWQAVEQQLYHYVPMAFDGIVYNLPTATHTDLQTPLSERDRKIKFQFKFPLQKARFRMGFVELEKRIKSFDEPLTFKIYNDSILPEFEHVKPYFAKVLGKRRIEISGLVEMKAGGEPQIHCTSKEIDKINEQMISSVKRLHIKQAVKAPRVLPIDKSLFTPEEFFDGMDGQEDLGNSFKLSEQELMESILRLKGIRNKKQLQYLSGKIQSKAEKIRFTLSPDFGFLFYASGDRMDHFIWELLNTHATYIWSNAKSKMPLDQKYKRIEEVINFIGNHGRMEYLRNENESGDFIFSKINHAQSGSDVIDGFPKWKAKINEKLV